MRGTVMLLLLPLASSGALHARAAWEAGRVTIAATASVNGIAVGELSGLAWDADAKLLYAVSDRGFVYHFRVAFDGDSLASVEPVYAATLARESGGPATGKGLNAEGLALRRMRGAAPAGDELVVPIEALPPRIACFTPDGRKSGELAVPSPLAESLALGRKNRGMEAVAFSPAYGLMTAPESPVPGQRGDRHTIYAEGHHWSFRRHSTDSRLKGMDVLPDGSLLVLERNRGPSKGSMMASLARVDLQSCPRGGQCTVEPLVVLPAGPENFEGMTLLDSAHVLLASDNGGKSADDTVLLLVKLP